MTPAARFMVALIAFAACLWLAISAYRRRYTFATYCASCGRRIADSDRPWQFALCASCQRGKVTS